MKRFDLAITISAVAIVAGGAGFAIGHATAGKTASAAASSRGQSGNPGFGGGGQAGGGFRRGGFGTRGTVTAVNGNTITMTDRNGSTQSVDVSSSTSYLNGSDRTAASLSDVTSGSTILAAGQTSGSTINATRIIINPPAPGGNGGGGGGAAPGSGSGSIMTN